VRQFYVPNAVPGRLDLSREESRHLAKVLRARVGDRVELVNGRGATFAAELLDVSPSRCQLMVEPPVQTQAASPELTIVIAPTKKTDRLEWFLEKACEIGVTRIQPIWTRRSERRVEKPERWNRVLVEAMKQCQDSWLPLLEPALDFPSFLEKYSTDDFGDAFRAFAHCPVNGHPTLERSEFWKHLQPQKDAIICIGPEGDFTPEEIQQAVEAGWKPVTFGPRRLRTETAALYAVQAFQIKQLSS
jgi:16S rRNA (uracil1498-N3)-methyltransferase